MLINQTFRTIIWLTIGFALFIGILFLVGLCVYINERIRIRKLDKIYKNDTKHNPNILH